jgi:ubiquinone/menaquinone biosynthesis C-methylase UbiE
MDVRERYDRASRIYNLITFGEDLRQGDDKRRLFSRARGRTILAAVGTGKNIKYFPPGLDLVGLDISPRMLERARAGAERYQGRIELRPWTFSSSTTPTAALIPR